MAVDDQELVAGRYRLVKPIAEGGMGTVWLARHLELDAEMALKLIREDLLNDRTARSRFRREARAAAKLRSPHIVRVHDFGVFEERPYLVMELLDGEDVKQRLKGGPLSLEATSKIIHGVLAALEVSHEEGVVHRDLKPSNIFLARAGDTEVVKVLDFGIAKAPTTEAAEDDADATTTTGSNVLGSPPYMSPEQARGDRLDHRTDLWSLAVIAYELLTGVRPFRGGFARMFTDIVMGKFTPVSEHDSELPEAFDAFFERAFSPQLEERLIDARAFRRAFDEACGNTMSPELATVVDHAPMVPTEARSADVETLARPPDDDTRAPTTRPVTDTHRSRSGRWVVAATVAVLLVGAWWWTRPPLPIDTTENNVAPADRSVEVTTTPDEEAAPAKTATAAARPSARAAPSASASAPIRPHARPPRFIPAPLPKSDEKTPKPPPSPKRDPFSGLPIDP